MEFRDLKEQYKRLKNEIDAEISQVLDNAAFIGGKKVAELEKKLAAYVGIKHCIACGNGTDALTLALMALGIGKGDCVFVPDFTFFASGEVVSYAGAVPVFVDVDRDTFNINPERLEEAVKKVLEEGKLKPGAVIAVDLFGLPADYEKIRKIADKFGLKIIEDGAQGFGGKIGEKRACSFGDIGTTSFFPAKPLGCYGDGGAVFVDDDGIAEYLHSVCVHGKGRSKYDNIRIGMNSRLDAIQAAVLLPKLRAFEEYELDLVNQAAAYYTEKLSSVVKVPVVPEGFFSSWAQYTIQLPEDGMRDRLQQFLKEQDIPSMIYYQKPMHRQTAFEAVVNPEECFPVADDLSKMVLSLPVHPYLTMEDADKVTDLIIKFISNYK